MSMRCHDCTAYDTDEFGLGRVSFLEMQAADYAFFCRHGLVVLNEFDVESQCGVEFALLKTFEKVASPVSEYLRLEDGYSFNVGLDEIHPG
jgi:hypothetical protein